MPFTSRSRLVRCITRLMCWVLLAGWFVGAANACVLLDRAAEPLRQAAAHPHEAAASEHHHPREAARVSDCHGDGHEGGPAQGRDTAPGLQACKHLCDGEQQAVAKAGAGELPWLHCVASATAASCLVVPAPAPAPAPRPDAGTLPAPPPIPIAFLRLTI
ncbi:hypothetical protein [Azohydromonas australica]|uniref:hypothetical protein n=1 Tax=Azohydromonas australica TaxID=364039 RepID=UPI000428F2B0|nr:hypothetical protein [Azohydromonas australica]